MIPSQNEMPLFKPLRWMKTKLSLACKGVLAFGVWMIDKMNGECYLNDKDNNWKIN